MIVVYVLGNVAAPIFSGITLFIFSAYFIFTNSITTNASRFFVTFLISFGIFVILRPVQLYLGPHPLPTIINNFRSMLFLSVAIPSLTMANLNFKLPVRKRIRDWTWGIGIALAIIYVTFHFLGVKGSRIAYFSVGLPAYEPYLPERFPPFYSREVTIAAYMIGGLMIAVSGFRLLSLNSNSNTSVTEIPKKYIYFGLGSFILGISFILGVLLKYWWIYYFASIFSTLVSGYGIIIDIREIQLRVGKTLPYVKGELTNLIRFQPDRKEELVELFHILELNPRINTFIIMEHRGVVKDLGQLEMIDLLLREMDILLKEYSGEGCSLLIPISRNKLGIIIFFPPENHNAPQEFCEQILARYQAEKNLTINFGIGRTVDNVRDLSVSYHDSVIAQAYTSFHNKSHIIHIDDVEKILPGGKRSVYDLSDLIIAIRTGNIKSTFSQFQLYYAWIFKESKGDLEKMKMRSLHLISTVTQEILSIEIQDLNMAEKTNNFYRDLLRIDNKDTLRQALIRIVEEVVNALSQAQKHKLSDVVIKTKKYIDENLNRNLSGQEIAATIGFSHSYLINIFKKETGVSLNNYINKTRIMKAKELLLTTDEPVTEIAYAVGFNDSNYFSTFFRKMEGMTPSNFRKSQKS